jgi:hypothetical protein
MKVGGMRKHPPTWHSDLYRRPEMLPDDTTVEVPLTQGFVAFIDAEDAADILRFR